VEAGRGARAGATGVYSFVRCRGVLQGLVCNFVKKEELKIFAKQEAEFFLKKGEGWKKV